MLSRNHDWIEQTVSDLDCAASAPRPGGEKRTWLPLVTLSYRDPPWRIFPPNLVQFPETLRPGRQDSCLNVRTGAGGVVWKIFDVEK